MPAPAHHARFMTLGLGLAAVVLGLAALYASLLLPEDGFLSPANPFADRATNAAADAALPLEDFLPGQAQNLSADAALARNLASPLMRVNPLPPPFQARWLSAGQLVEASDCLTRAIYYEANGEPALGQMAVAQVILNRVRHPRFPKTVCGVVNQGSERATGCQFTFTCDGSLARVPDPVGLSRARGVAEAALHGAVSALAGQATHYHATYIVPVWAQEMAKVAIVGHHVFYRPPGFYGVYPLLVTSPKLEEAPRLEAGLVMPPISGELAGGGAGVGVVVWSAPGAGNGGGAAGEIGHAGSAMHLPGSRAASTGMQNNGTAGDAGTAQRQVASSGGGQLGSESGNGTATNPPAQGGNPYFPNRRRNAPALALPSH